MGGRFWTSGVTRNLMLGILGKSGGTGHIFGVSTPNPIKKRFKKINGFSSFRVNWPNNVDTIKYQRKCCNLSKLHVFVYNHRVITIMIKTKSEQKITHHNPFQAVVDTKFIKRVRSYFVCKCHLTENRNFIWHTWIYFPDQQYTKH